MEFRIADTFTDSLAGAVRRQVPWETLQQVLFPDRTRTSGLLRVWIRRK